MAQVEESTRPETGLEGEKRDTAERLLLLCLQGRFHARALEEARAFAAREALDWQRVEGIIERERIGPLLYTLVRGEGLFPEALVERLRQTAVKRATANAFYYHELREVLARLQEAGIETILLKGTALAKSVYGTAVPRYFGDLDLLLRQGNMDDAMAALAELGYLPEDAFAVGAAEMVPFAHEWQLRKEGAIDVEVDLHWHLFAWPAWQVSTPMAWFWETARLVDWQGIPTAVLGDEAALLHLCAHVQQHSGERWRHALRLLHDIAEIVDQHKESIDWRLLAQRAQTYRLTIPLRQILLYVFDAWRLDVPQVAREAIAGLRPAAEEARVFAQLRALDGASEARLAAVSLAHLPGWRARAHYVARNLLFPHAAYMRHRYRIRRPYLLPLYYPYRWYLGLASGVAGWRGGKII